MAPDTEEALGRICGFNLGVKKTERVLVFTDRLMPRERAALPPRELKRRAALREIARQAAAAGKRYAKEVIYLEYPSRGAPAVEPPEAAWRAAFGAKTIEALKKKNLLLPILRKKISEEALKEAEAITRKNARLSVDAVIALPNFSTTHTIFRRLLTGQAEARYASMPLFDPSMLRGPLLVDYRRLKRICHAVARALRRADTLELRSPNGTLLTVKRGNRIVKEDTGDLRKPGAGGNLPAGEVFFAPIEGTARGRLVLEWAPTRRLASPVTLTVEGGLVVKVEGSEPYARELRERLRAPGCSNIAELGIGTNDMARRPDNILESEKILGTVHVALGDNSTFGGSVKAPFHQDFVFFNPTLTLFDKKGGRVVALIKKGRLEVKNP